MITTQSARFLNWALRILTLATFLVASCGPRGGLDPEPPPGTDEPPPPPDSDAVVPPPPPPVDACPVRTNPALAATSAALPPFCAAAVSGPVIAPNADRVLLIVDAAPLTIERKRWSFLQKPVRAHSELVPGGPLDNKFISNMTSVQCALSFPKNAEQAKSLTQGVLKAIAREPDDHICEKGGKKHTGAQTAGCIVDLLSTCSGADAGHTNISSALQEVVKSKNYDMILLAFDGVEDYQSDGNSGATTGNRWPEEVGKLFAEGSGWSVHVVGVPAAHRQLYVITRVMFVDYARSVVEPLRKWVASGDESRAQESFAAELWPGSWHDPGVRLDSLNAVIRLEKPDPLLKVSCASNAKDGLCSTEEGNYPASKLAVGLRVSMAKWVGSATLATLNWELTWAPQALSREATATYALPIGLVRPANQGRLVSSATFQAVASAVPQWTSLGAKVEATPGLESCVGSALWDENDANVPRHASLFQVAGVDLAAGTLRGVIAKAGHESEAKPESGEQGGGLVAAFAKHLAWIHGRQAHKAQHNDAEILANAAMGNKNLGLSAFAVLSNPPEYSKCIQQVKELLASNDDAIVLEKLGAVAAGCKDDALLAVVTHAMAKAPAEAHREGKGNAGVAMSDKRQGDITLLRVIVKAADAAIARLGASSEHGGQCTAAALRWLGR